MFSPEGADGYPVEVRESLEESRRLGLSFEAAKQRAPRAPRDWQARYVSLDSEETPLQFMWRHFEAAYHRVDAARYCTDPSCFSLAVTRSGSCSEHRQAA